MTQNILIIPADSRSPVSKTPMITNEMKALCIGEFAWEEQADYFDGNGNVIEFTATREVPWDLCKQIYKRMAQIAALDLST